MMKTKNRNLRKAFESNHIPTKFNSKHFESSEFLKAFAESRLKAIVEKYALRESTCRTEFWFDVDEHNQKASMRIRLPSRYLHVSAEGDSMYESVHKMMNRLEVLIRKVKDKNKSNQRRKSLSKRNGLYAVSPIHATA